MFDHLGGFHQHHDHSLPVVSHNLTSFNTHIGGKTGFRRQRRQVSNFQVGIGAQ
jgi:hypothetical protein